MIVCSQCGVVLSPAGDARRSGNDTELPLRYLKDTDLVQAVERGRPLNRNARMNARVLCQCGTRLGKLMATGTQFMLRRQGFALQAGGAPPAAAVAVAVAAAAGPPPGVAMAAAAGAPPGVALVQGAALPDNLLAARRAAAAAQRELQRMQDALATQRAIVVQAQRDVAMMEARVN